MRACFPRLRGAIAFGMASTTHPLLSFLLQIDASQGDLARESGVSQPLLSQIINRRRKATPSAAQLIEKGCVALKKKARARIKVPTAAELVFLRAG